MSSIVGWGHKQSHLTLIVNSLSFHISLVSKTTSYKKNIFFSFLVCEFKASNMERLFNQDAARGWRVPYCIRFLPKNIGVCVGKTSKMPNIYILLLFCNAKSVCKQHLKDAKHLFFTAFWHLSAITYFTHTCWKIWSFQNNFLTY